LTQRQLVTFAILTCNRSQDLQVCLDSILRQHYQPIEIVVIDNASTDDTEEVMQKRYNLTLINYFKLLENKGSVGGKNIAIQKSKGDIIISIDDDALLIDSEATQKIVDRFLRDRKVGLLTFKSLNYYTNKIAREEFPHRDKSLNPDIEFETSYFIGVGYAIKREVYEKVGLYPGDFFYGFEELDLSFRILDAGYRIVYFPQVTVLHKKSPKGRMLPNSVWLNMLMNRIKVSIRNLPWRYVIGSIIIWSGHILLKTKGNVVVVFKAFKNIAKDIQNLLQQRRSIAPGTIGKVHRLRGRLLY